LQSATKIKQQSRRDRLAVIIIALRRSTNSRTVPAAESFPPLL
jgi:hypothetical protein